METYQALKIIDLYRQSLTEANIVICTEISVEYGETDVIGYEYKDLYPEFEVVTCIINNDEQ
jgi:hypothetical protein